MRKGTCKYTKKRCLCRNRNGKVVFAKKGRCRRR